MTPTKDQQAQEYAEKKNNERLSAYPEAMRPDLHPEYDINDIEQAYSDGYTACEQSMWRSVEEEEPPISKIFLCRDADSVALCTYDGEDMYEVHNDCKCRMPFWMPIPSLPETNTKKI